MERTVLVIEDEHDHQYIILSRLMRAGYSDVKVVTSLEEGVSACTERPRDILVIDSGVVGENIEDAVTQLRDSCPKARLIGYSAGAQKEKWADAHVAKGDPFDVLLAAMRGE